MAPAAAAAPRLLRLRKLALKRVGLDEQHIGVGFSVGVLGGGVDTNQIARNELEILQRERGRAVDLFFALLLEQIDRSLGASVDRIIQRDTAETILAGGLGGYGDLFDWAGVVVAPG